MILIALGGAAGSVLRALSVSLVGRLSAPHWGTFAVNLLGSFVMGLAFAWLIERMGGHRAAAPLMTGVLGGFTTFSAFSLDAIRLAEAGRFGQMALYMGMTVALGVVALLAGLALGRSIAL